MAVRRGFWWCQWVAAFVLPLWLLIGWPFFGPGGWMFLVVLVGSAALFVAMLVLAALATGRTGIRRDRAFDWWDILYFVILDTLVITLGFYGAIAATIAVILLVIVIGGFWLLLARLVWEGHTKVTSTHFWRTTVTR